MVQFSEIASTIDEEVFLTRRPRTGGSANTKVTVWDVELVQPRTHRAR